MEYEQKNSFDKKKIHLPNDFIFPVLTHFELCSIDFSLFFI